jgi:hypothetical protein
MSVLENHEGINKEILNKVLADQEAQMLGPVCDALLLLWDAYMAGTMLPEHRPVVAKGYALVQARKTLRELHENN